MVSRAMDPPAPASFIRTPSTILHGGRKSLTSLWRCEGGTLPYATPMTAVLTVSKQASVPQPNFWSTTEETAARFGYPGRDFL